MSPKISIIIPCFNSEVTLDETLLSVLEQDFKDWEAIIVNDGSTDGTEKIALRYVDNDKRIKYFKKENGGLGSARNLGLKNASGKYVLPLDSDNLIEPGFIVNSIKILEKQQDIGVVYGDAKYFGDKNSVWKVGGFDKYKMLKHNYIDACAVIRSALFIEIGTYDENLPYQGHEDWDFWLRVISSRFDFFYLESISFKYRVSANSMIKSFNGDMMNQNIYYIKSKHVNLYENTLWDVKAKYDNLIKESKKSILSKLIKRFK